MLKAARALISVFDKRNIETFAEGLANQGIEILSTGGTFKTLQDAIRRGASDIHIEPYEGLTRIRYRIDGVLHDAINPPPGLVHKIVARLKILSQLDIAERRLPQDGRMKLQFSRNRTIDFRVSTMPTLFGEKMVIRVLDTGSANLGLETIGMDESEANA